MAEFFYKVARRMQKGAKDFLDIPVTQEVQFLDSLPIPATDIQRSYNQYLCQNFYKSRVVICALNVASAVLCPFVLLLLLAKGLFVKRRDAGFDAVCDLGHFRDVTPQALQKEFRLDYDHWFKNNSLSVRDVSFIWRVCAYKPFAAFFGLKNVLKIGYYSDMLRRFPLKAVVTHNEYAFTSSVLTAYCEFCGVEHIDVMHGEKVFRLRDTFFRFHRSYVWGEHYIRLFKKLRADNNRFIVYAPAALSIDVEQNASEEHYADVKYYLQIYDKAQLTSIVSAMEKLKEQGLSVKYRPHPRYSDMAMLKSMVDQTEIENPKDVSVAVSISNLTYAAGSFTTVMNQAYVSGKKVVMDDVTYPHRMSLLRDRLYIFTEQTENCLLLSTLINKLDK